MHVSNIPITELKPFAKNPKKHPENQMQMLKKSMKEFGWTNPILIADDNMVVAGHARLQAATELGFTEVPVIKLDMPYEKAVAYVIADNRLAELAETDNILMQELLSEVIKLEDFDFEATGYELDELESLIEEVTPREIVEDVPPEVPEEPVTVRGDVWELGRHRLMCGDSTLNDDVEKLMNGGRADMVFTDPPYGIKHSGKGITANGVDGNDFGEILGDSDISVAVNSFNLAMEMFSDSTMIFWGANYYASALPNGFGWLVWDKEREGNTFSGAELAFVNRGVRLDVFRHMWHGMIKASEHGQARVHPTQKPIALATWCFENYDNPGSVLDFFGGSGSTLIACEQTNRINYSMELDPHYCDVIIQRYVNFTGNNKLTRNGEPYIWQADQKEQQK